MLVFLSLSESVSLPLLLFHPICFGRNAFHASEETSETALSRPEFLLAGFLHLALAFRAGSLIPDVNPIATALQA